MRAWPGLFVAPLTALTHLTLVFGMSTPSCRMQSEALLHGVSVAALVVALACTAMAARAWRHAPGVQTDSNERRRFIAAVATGVGALSTVVIVALWLPPWWLSPCWA
jgi:L-aminopeptidase/D-esterase-like protein